MSGHGLGVFVICPLEAYTTSFVCASGVGTISNHNIPMQPGNLGLLTEDFMSGVLYLKYLNLRVGNKSSLCVPSVLLHFCRDSPFTLTHTAGFVMSHSKNKSSAIVH